MARRIPLYVALIGDVVASRDLSANRRAALQKELRSWLDDDLNAALGPDVAAPLTLTAGDELQGLFRKPSAVVRVVQELTDRMFQLPEQPRILFGVGRGALSTGSVPAPPAHAGNPALLDGPAFHNARSALERAQDEGGWARFVGFGEPAGDTTTDEVLDALFTLMATIRDQWTAKQGELSHRMRAVGGESAGLQSQSDLAKRLRVSPSVVSETLKAARHRALVEGEDAARRLLARLDGS